MHATESISQAQEIHELTVVPVPFFLRSCVHSSLHLQVDQRLPPVRFIMKSGPEDFALIAPTQRAFVDMSVIFRLRESLDVTLSGMLGDSEVKEFHVRSPKWDDPFFRNSSTWASSTRIFEFSLSTFLLWMAISSSNRSFSRREYSS